VRTDILFIAAAAGLLVLASCRTVQKDVREGRTTAQKARDEAYRSLEGSETALEDSRRRGETDELPYWAREFPVLDDQYVGVGHSPDTGVPDEDRRRARLDALNELAQGISVHITSEIRDKRRDRYGKYYEDLEINIRTSVDLTVQDAELVDSYYSKEEGYWVYYRLSRQAWERMQAERKRLLSDRVKRMVESPLDDPTLAVAEKVGILSRAIRMVVDSGFAGVVRTDIFERNGYLLDLLIEKRDTLIASLALEVMPGELLVSPRGTADIEVSVTAGDGSIPGTVRVSFSEIDGDSVSEITTKADGRYSGIVDLSRLGFGRSVVTAGIDGYDSNERDMFSRPEIDIPVYRRPFTALLTVVDTGGLSYESVYSSALDILSFLDSPGMKITTTADDHDLVVEFSPIFRLIQNTSYRMLVAYAGTRVSLLDGGDVLFSFKSGEFKEVGLDELQAKQRAFNKLVSTLRTDTGFQNRVEDALDAVFAP
jgi:DNA-binding transcriptional ArsR family regulator